MATHLIRFHRWLFFPVQVARPDEEEEDDDVPNIEEMPTIATVEDERPQEVRVLEEFKKSGRWKTFTGQAP